MIISFFILPRLISGKFIKDRQIKVAVETNWSSSPFSEMICYFNEFQSNSYPCLIKNLNSLTKYPSDIDSTIDFAKKCLTDNQISYLKYLLHYHFYSPRVSFYSNINVTSNFSLTNATSNFPFEPHFSEIIYFDFGTNKKKKFSNNITIRPISSISDKKQFINGYGVEFRPFRYSMEYGIKDASPVKTSSDSIEKDETLNKILNTNPDDHSMPNSEQLISSFIPYLNSLDDKNSSQILDHINCIVDNWPVSAKIITTEEDKSIQKEYLDSQSDLPFDISSDGNIVLFNGRVIDIDLLDPFSFASVYAEEIKIMKILKQKFNLNDNVLHWLASLQVQKRPLTLDTRNVPIIWLNDLEKENKYKNYKNSLTNVFKALRSPPKIRQNLINIVVVFNPLSRDHIKSLSPLIDKILHGYATRLGIIPVIEDDEQNLTQSMYVLGLFSELINQGTQKSLSFMTKLLSLIDENDLITSYKETASIFNIQNPDQQNAKILQSTFHQLGIKTPSLIVNGKLFEGEGQIDMFEYYALQSIETIRKVIKTPDFSGNVYDTVLKCEKAVTKKNSKIHDYIHPLHLSTASSDEISHFIDFLYTINYKYQDSEFSYVTMIVFNSNNQIQKNIDAFFNDEHQIPVRIGFVNHIPDDFPFLASSISKNCCTLLINGRIMVIDEHFTDFELLIQNAADLFGESLAQQFLNSPSLSKFNHESLRTIHNVWTTLLLDWDYHEILRKHLHPNLFDSDSPGVISIESSNSLEFQAIVNPFSSNSPKIIGFINSLSCYGFVDISIRFNIPQTLKSIPTSFYRYVTDDYALFGLMNDTITYSIISHPPETWLLAQKRADVDVDNVFAKELNPGVYSTIYSLSQIVIEGRAIDQNNHYCDGVHLSLSKGNEIVSDTMILKHKGYWQLRVQSPGLYNINLASSSSRAKYENYSPYQIVSSFSVYETEVKLHLKTDQKETISALDDSHDDGKIHIFAVASGKLYERLVKIMMVSAIKHAENATIKFWLFENFMSPKFRKVIPKMAKEYNFEYELVAYKWPRWLKRQSEKQRITWGNKILFLDVLFPLSLKRVIYVDSDQIIRTNMRELMTLDMKEAPYAFTPFCDSRKEIEPFRFWKRGYWKARLGSKKYHISALFAVDLKRLREISGGDRLRYYYSQLVDDENSLANLDQDLPNYAQDKIPIYSLPQNWLWCESWCSDDTMSSAKTIDLCNNPLTKKPKLEIAKTRVSEWPSLDREISRFDYENDEL